MSRAAPVPALAAVADAARDPRLAVPVLLAVTLALVFTAYPQPMLTGSSNLISYDDTLLGLARVTLYALVAAAVAHAAGPRGAPPLARVRDAAILYAGVAAVALLSAAGLGAALGWVVLEAAAWMLAIPLLALYAFMVGVAWVARALTGGRAVAALLAITAFVVLTTLAENTPTHLGGLALANPLAMAMEGAVAVAYGLPYPWAATAWSLALGAALAALAPPVARRRGVGV